jgi:hypothetical protein
MDARKAKLGPVLTQVLAMLRTGVVLSRTQTYFSIKRAEPPSSFRRNKLFSEHKHIGKGFLILKKKMAGGHGGQTVGSTAGGA